MSLIHRNLHHNATQSHEPDCTKLIKVSMLIYHVMYQKQNGTYHQKLNGMPDLVRFRKGIAIPEKDGIKRRKYEK